MKRKEQAPTKVGGYEREVKQTAPTRETASLVYTPHLQRKEAGELRICDNGACGLCRASNAPEAL